MNKTLKIHFYLKKRGTYVSGDLPIYLRLTVDGKRTEFSTQREWDPSKWNQKAGRATGLKKEETRQLNSFLETLQSKIYEAQRELLNKGIDVTANLIRNKLLGKEEIGKTLLEVYSHHVQQVAALVGRGYAQGTLKRYKAALSSLEAFLKHQQKGDVPLRDLKYQFITDYEFFLKTVRNVDHNTAMGIIKKLKTIVRQCVANNWIEKDPFISFKIRIHDTNRAFLLQDELDRIIEKTFLSDRLTSVRDIFVFSCYTGLAYADVKKLTRADIVTGIDGEQWIYTERVKTEATTRLPILPAALRILEKYRTHPQCVNEGKLLPVISNAKMNEYLKEIAERCEINKELTFHCARHTFATTVTLTNGVPIETVSKMLGHRSLRTTQQYAKILDRKISDDMKALRNKLDSRSGDAATA
ncbi:site-specific integrase [Fulvivirgaceae bacterium PWU4]|uniref:Site-specific integrase n=1 Tax=Chryseosolibacter histidini TaxID=2782349 RepID=A0AAP2DGV9_9BACT|nr:site-specific integrase [Chryseosolibacter histidini]MBT1696080.1 site-specific integrase [Chryseosolibacter histidini]